MLCEKCGQEFGSVVCGGCNQTILKLGAFCYICGKKIEQENENIECEPGNEEEIDFSKRILCSDGTCIGVVENGVCKICGKPYVPESPL